MREIVDAIMPITPQPFWLFALCLVFQLFGEWLLVLLCWGILANF